jgi:exosortase/archaeosortase family protein
MGRKRGDKRRPVARRHPPAQETRSASAKAEGARTFKRAAQFFAERRAPLVYLVRFTLIAGVLLSVYYFPYNPRGLAAALLQRYLVAYARLAGAALSIFDPRVHVDGTHILGRFNLDFAMNCDAMDVYILFGAAVGACPSSWRNRLLGLGAGLMVLVAINVTRIVSLYWVGVHFPLLFDFCHVELWPIVIVALTCAGFLIWARGAGVGRSLVSDAAQS